MKIRVFGKLTDIIPSEVEVDFPMTVSVFRQWLAGQYPTLKNMDFCIAVNQNLVNDDTYTIHPNDELALLPPFSGG